MANALTFRTIDLRDLSESDHASWLRIRQGNPDLESPYHHPDYHALAAKHQGGVRATLACAQDGSLVAVLPWQGGRFARPSGAPLSDYQAVIREHSRDLGVSDMLKDQKVGAFHYSAMPSSEGEETCRLEIETPELWRGDRDSSYRRHLKSTRRRIRKAEDAFGPRRMVFQSRDIDAYQALIHWKRDKFAETGKFDVLDNPGTSGLLRELWERGPDAGLRADLHVLYFGDRIAACDLGLTDGTVFHSWIVGYDPDLHGHAPGIQLLEGLIDATVSTGYTVIDLGPGTDGYKRHYATHSKNIASGVVTLPSFAGWTAAAYDRAEHALGGATNDALGKLRRRYSQIAACESRTSRRVSALGAAIASGGQGKPA